MKVAFDYPRGSYDTGGEMDGEISGGDGIPGGE